jgi:hypothetical protein
MKFKRKRGVAKDYYVNVKGIIPEEIKQRISRIHAEAFIKSAENSEKAGHSRV